MSFQHFTLGLGQNQGWGTLGNRVGGGELGFSMLGGGLSGEEGGASGMKGSLDVSVPASLTSDRSL